MTIQGRRLVGLALVLGLGATFFPVLLLGEQFGYRDTADFYYPLFETIQAEWQAGRVPLWNPFESSGTPLLANPTASVFYPGKLLFFMPWSYGLSFRLYVVLHVLLCVGTASRLVRGFGVSTVAAGLCGIGYALSGVVLAQCSNVVFLVGAAWAPLALALGERTVRNRCWSSAAGFGAVLALQVLGGDPQAAYLCGLLSVLYAVVHGAHALGGSKPLLSRTWSRHPLTLLVAAGGLGLTLSLVQVLPTRELARLSERATRALPHNLYEYVASGLRGDPLPERRDADRPGQRHARHDALLGAGPDEAKHTYRFSTGPWRWPELVWPGITGHRFPLNRHWPRIWSAAHDVWSPSIYQGLLPLLLAGLALRLRRAPPQQIWMSCVALFGVIGALGRFGLLGWIRWLLGSGVGGNAGDEVGGLYWLLTLVLPGFADFRYPAKLMVFAALGVAALAAWGWDRLVEASDRRLVRGLVVVGGLSLLGLAVSTLAAGALESWISSGADAARDPYYGPLDVPGARSDVQVAFLHAALVALGTLALLRVARSPTRRSVALAGLLLLVTVDIVVANRWVVPTVPQAEFDRTPHALSVIREREERSGANEPFRIYRPAVFYPIGWGIEGSGNRVEEILRWNRDSLKPKVGLPYGVEDMAVRGTLNLRPYHYFYTGWPEPTDPDARRRYPELPPTSIRHSRLAFDAWNVKYFVLPRVITPGMVADQHRSIQSFVELPAGQPAPVLYSPPRETMANVDYQVVLNPDPFPRAWIVHEVERIPPQESMTRAALLEIVRSITVEQRHDLRRKALVEAADRADIRSLASPAAEGVAERAAVVLHEPDHVAIEGHAGSPGLLVLADSFYPGWTAHVNGQPSAIHRANLSMRALAVPAGSFEVDLRYEPTRFRLGAWVSGLTWLALGLGVLISRGTGPRGRSPGPPSPDDAASPPDRR